MPDGRNQRGAFTLLELLVVLVIVIVIAGITVPRFSGSYQKMLIRKSADDIAFSLRYLQARAMADGAPCRLVFDDGFRSYWLEEGEPDPLSDEKDLVFGRLKGRWGRLREIHDQVLIQSPRSVVEVGPDGVFEPVSLEACVKERCAIVSTEYQRGRVKVWEGGSDENS